MTSSRGSRPHLTSAAIARKAGRMGLATFGTFDDATDTGTRSVVPAEAAGR